MVPLRTRQEIESMRRAGRVVADVLAQYGSMLTLETSPLGGCRARFAAPT